MIDINNSTYMYVHTDNITKSLIQIRIICKATKLKLQVKVCIQICKVENRNEYNF